jgi:hypothetical protein
VEVTQEQRTSSIRAILDGLVLERQRLRRSSDGTALLEANRRSIVYWQTELSRALLAERGHDIQ